MQQARRAFRATKPQLWALGIALFAYYPVALAVVPSKSGGLIVPVVLDAVCFTLIWHGKRVGWWLEVIRQGASMWLAIISPAFFDSGALVAAAIASGAAALAALLWIWTPRIANVV